MNRPVFLLTCVEKSIVQVAPVLGCCMECAPRGCHMHIHDVVKLKMSTTWHHGTGQQHLWSACDPVQRAKRDTIIGAAAPCRAWCSGLERPFLLDNVRDLSAVLDYLTGHPNVDAERIGMAGVSLGGMHTWLCAAIDSRVAAAAPMIGVHSFQWQLHNNAFHGRVDSLRNAFKQICNDCGKVCPKLACTTSGGHRVSSQWVPVFGQNDRSGTARRGLLMLRSCRTCGTGCSQGCWRTMTPPGRCHASHRGHC